MQAGLQAEVGKRVVVSSPPRLVGCSPQSSDFVLYSTRTVLVRLCVSDVVDASDCDPLIGSWTPISASVGNVASRYCNC